LAVTIKPKAIYISRGHHVMILHPPENYVTCSHDRSVGRWPCKTSI